MKTCLNLTTTLLASLNNNPFSPSFSQEKHYCDHLTQFYLDCGQAFHCFNTSYGYTSYNVDHGISLTYRKSHPDLHNLYKHIDHFNSQTPMNESHYTINWGYLSYQDENQTRLTYQLPRQIRHSTIASQQIHFSPPRKKDNPLIKQDEDSEAYHTLSNPTVAYHTLSNPTLSITSYNNSRSYKGANNRNRFNYKTTRDQVDNIPLFQIADKTSCAATQVMSKTNFYFDNEQLSRHIIQWHFRDLPQVKSHPHPPSASVYSGRTAAHHIADTPQLFTMSFNDYLSRPRHLTLLLRFPPHLRHNPAYIKLNTCLQKQASRCRFIGTWNDVFSMSIHQPSYCPYNQDDYRKSINIRLTSYNHNQECYVQLHLKTEEIFVIPTLMSNGVFSKDLLNQTNIDISYNNSTLPDHATQMPCNDNSQFALNLTSLHPDINMTLTKCLNTQEQAQHYRPQEKLKIRIAHKINQYGSVHVPYQYSTWTHSSCQQPFIIKASFTLSIWPELLTYNTNRTSIILSKNKSVIPFNTTSLNWNHPQKLVQAHYRFTIYLNNQPQSSHMNLIATKNHLRQHLQDSANNFYDHVHRNLDCIGYEATNQTSCQQQIIVKIKVQDAKSQRFKEYTVLHTAFKTHLPHNTTTPHLDRHPNKKTRQHKSTSSTTLNTGFIPFQFKRAILISTLLIGCSRVFIKIHVSIIYETPICMMSSQNKERLLCLAAKTNLLFLLAPLLQFPINVNRQDNLGSNALMLAISHNCNSIALELMRHRYTNLNLQNNPDKRTALMLAANNNNILLLINLINHGAHLDIRDTHGNTVIDFAGDPTREQCRELIHWLHTIYDFLTINTHFSTPVLNSLSSILNHKPEFLAATLDGVDPLNRLFDSGLLTYGGQDSNTQFFLTLKGLSKPIYLTNNPFDGSTQSQQIHQHIRTLKAQFYAPGVRKFGRFFLPSNDIKPRLYIELEEFTFKKNDGALLSCLPYELWCLLISFLSFSKQLTFSSAAHTLMQGVVIEVPHHLFQRIR